MATSRRVLWLGLALVLLAGFFREYDQEDLLAEPWFLLLPVVASIAVIFVLYVVMHSLPGVRGSGLSRVVKLRRLATCFWMTAPIAAIYAIPVERFLDPGTAMETNLWFLLVVSLWRVSLMTRVLQVCYGDSGWRCLFCVMLIGDTAALLFTVFIPIPILEVMGGIGLTEREQVINTARALVFLPGGATFLLWFFGTVSNLTRPPRTKGQMPDSSHTAPVARTTWMAMTLAFAIMLGACLWTQPEQQRAHRFERQLRGGSYADAIATLNQSVPEQLPPHWEPIPHVGYRQSKPDPFQVLSATLDHEGTQDWITDLYARKIRQIKGTGFFAMNFWDRLTNEELETVVRLLEDHPRWRPLLDESADRWEKPIRCWIRDILEDRWTRAKKLPPKALLLRLLEVSEDRPDCPTKEQLWSRIAETLR